MGKATDKQVEQAAYHLTGIAIDIATLALSVETIVSKIKNIRGVKCPISKSTASNSLSKALNVLDDTKIDHILKGSTGTRAGHSWEKLFNGIKPSFDEIKPIIQDVYKNGKVKTTLQTPIGTKVTKTLMVQGEEVWVEIIQGTDKIIITNAGVNNWR